ncbi:MAG TPA: hypothetical protein VFA20_32680 [Myxococcaceae bacterium]|nr:hypothetical protein [Myxococcaceae bacterium]
MAPRQPLTLRKAIISVLMVAWLAVLLWSLQRKYDDSDYRKVDELVVASGAPWSLEKELLARNPGNAPRCEKELTSSFRGLVNLTCTAAGVDPYRFEVDLVRRRIRGRDARAAEVMAAVEMKRQAPDSGAR